MSIFASFVGALRAQYGEFADLFVRDPRVDLVHRDYAVTKKFLHVTSLTDVAAASEHHVIATRNWNYAPTAGRWRSRFYGKTADSLSELDSYLTATIESAPFQAECLRGIRALALRAPGDDEIVVFEISFGYRISSPCVRYYIPSVLASGADRHVVQAPLWAYMVMRDAMAFEMRKPDYECVGTIPLAVGPCHPLPSAGDLADAFRLWSPSSGEVYAVFTDALTAVQALT